jgi:hypothetical protein
MHSVDSLDLRLAEMARFKAQWDEMWLDEDLGRRIAKKEELIAWKGRICADDEAPLIRALTVAGFKGGSVWDLVNTRTPYPHLIETLIDHVKLNYLPITKEGIVRALMTQETGSSAREALVGLWREGAGKSDKALGWALAYVISYLTPRAKIGELADLMDGDDDVDHPFIRRLKKSEAGRRMLSARHEELE